MSTSKVLLGAPVQVSPLIRAGRWSALIIGFIWGGHRLKVHKREEEIFRAAEANRKAIRDVHMAEEKKRLAKLEFQELGKQAGIPDLARQAGILD